MIFLFVHGAEPAQAIKRYFYLGEEQPEYNQLHWWLIRLVNCSLCTGFWTGLIYYQDIYMACITAVSAEILTKKLI